MSLRCIYKYPFEIQDRVVIELPCEHQILKVEYQDGAGPCLWALVDPADETHPYPFRVFGTGRRFDTGEFAEFVGTFQLGSFVWHVFRGAE